MQQLERLSFKSRPFAIETIGASWPDFENLTEIRPASLTAMPQRCIGSKTGRS